MGKISDGERKIGIHNAHHWRGCHLDCDEAEFVVCRIGKAVAGGSQSHMLIKSAIAKRASQIAGCILHP